MKNDVSSFFYYSIGYNVDDALMDACDYLAQAGEYPQDDIVSIEKVEEEQA